LHVPKPVAFGFLQQRSGGTLGSFIFREVKEQKNAGDQISYLSLRDRILAEKQSMVSV
jgi:hypothetical protein